MPQPLRSAWNERGLGIVFLEAAAAGVPRIAGDSGGAAEAVVHGETGLVVDALPRTPGGWRKRSAPCWPTPSAGAHGPQPGRVPGSLDYEVLASRLASTLAEVTG